MGLYGGDGYCPHLGLDLKSNLLLCPEVKAVENFLAVECLLMVFK